MCCLCYGMSTWIGILVSWIRRMNCKPRLLHLLGDLGSDLEFFFHQCLCHSLKNIVLKKNKKKQKNCLKLEKPQITFSGIYGSSLMTNDAYFTISKHFLPKPASEATEIGW